MKKFLSLVIVLITSTTLYAQSDVTKFLGIPVDGFKHEMIQKLKAKGFVSASYDNQILEGEFNGTDVEVHVVTNNNKVYRIMVVDKVCMNETDIRIRFNNLCHQFINNSKYCFFGYYCIPEDEDISYEMIVNNKRYQAVFYQKPDISEEEFNNLCRNACLQKYTQEELDNPTEEMKEYIFNTALSFVLNKQVWFMICESYGEYYIAMYYDNVYNQANGEDL